MSHPLFRAVAIVLAVVGCLSVAGCGKKGDPSPPGPQDKVTWPRVYPTH